MPYVGSKRALLSSGSRTNPDVWQYQVTPTAGYSHTPVITRYTGSPPALWDWGDGSPLESGDSMAHTYAVARTYTVTVRIPSIAQRLKTVDVGTDKVSGDFMRTLLPMTRLTSIDARINALINSNCGAFNIDNWPLLVNLIVFSTGVSGNISGWVLPASLVSFYINSTGVSGNISGWVLPASLVNFLINSTSVSGSISGWVLPTSLGSFYITSTSVSGAPVFTSAAALATFNYDNCALPQATVDAILAAMYARRMSFTAASPAANLGGTNSDPGGVYAEETPPVSGMGFKYELVVDPKGNGHHKWAITT